MYISKKVNKMISKQVYHKTQIVIQNERMITEKTDKIHCMALDVIAEHLSNYKWHVAHNYERCIDYNYKSSVAQNCEQHVTQCTPSFTCLAKIRSVLISPFFKFYNEQL